MKNGNPIEMMLWSIALPGFGQILNGKLGKGILFIVLELIVNVNSNLNEIIMLSFQGSANLAVEHVNYRWLMFYPCIYLFAAWDAYRDAKGHTDRYEFLPFVLSAYFGTLGVVYSPSFRIAGLLLGPVWLPIICLVLGVLLGLMLRHFIPR